MSVVWLEPELRLSRVRRLPLRLEPAYDESLASYVDRLCVELDAPRGVMLEAIGLVDDPARMAGLVGFGAVLAAERHDALAFAARLEPEEVDRLLLSRYNGTALDFSRLKALTARGFRDFAQCEWAHFTGSNACPRCLDESRGIWKASWKLPWSFACLKHEVLLAHSCPRCERRLASGRGITRPHFPFHVPKPTLCTNQTPADRGGRGRSGGPCGAPLTSLAVEALAAHRRVLNTQQQLADALEADSVWTLGEHVGTRSYFVDLRSICAFLLAFAELEELGELPPVATRAFKDWALHRAARVESRSRTAGSGLNYRIRVDTYTPTPRTPELVAAIAPLAHDALTTSSVEAFADQIEPIIRRLTNERRYNALPVWTQQFAFSARLKGATEILMTRRSHYSGRASVEWLETGRSRSHTFTATHIPQLLWLDVFERDFAAPLDGIADVPLLRRLLSMSLLMLAEPYSWRQAADALELPVHHNNQASFVASLRSRGVDDLIADRLHATAARLEVDRSRTDYGARRQALVRLDDIDPTEWLSICLRTDGCGGEPGRRRQYAAAWLWAELTQGDPRLAPALSRKGPLPGGYQRFVEGAPDELLCFLRGYGVRLLKQSLGRSGIPAADLR